MHIHECCECGYSVFLSEDGRTDTDYKLVQVCVLKEERNIGRALSAHRHFSLKIYAWLLRALSSDRVTYFSAKIPSSFSASQSHVTAAVQVTILMNVCVRTSKSMIYWIMTGIPRMGNE